MRALSVVFAVAAATLMVVAIAGMVTGRPGAWAGLLARVAALACFIAAVALNVVSH